MALPTSEELGKRVLECNPQANIEIVSKAYDLAKQIHAGQTRVTYKDDLFAHALRMTLAAVQTRLDSASIAAALLHNVLEYTKTKPERLQELFGEEVLKLVEALTKFKRIRFESNEEEKAESIRKVLLASAKDIRVIILKLLDMSENMRCLDHVPEERRKVLAREALDIYAPIAHKLGMHKVKSELEDLALPILDPEKYQYIMQKVAETKEERERQVQRLIEDIKGKLQDSGIKSTIYGRAKSYYSIYKKLQDRYSSFDDIHDLLAIRIIVPTTEECYKTLGIIHGTWRHVPHLFGDYIANPKPNGYQSIHTKIWVNERIIEVQIRSIEMHREAEEGIAAHWLYKGTERDKRFDKKISWLKQILEWQAKSANARDFIETLKIDLFKGEIIVFSPKGEPITLPEGSTPLDFAYEVHSVLGNHCARAKVNNVLVPLDATLSSGDIVEIITAKNIVPSRHWLTFVKTAHARSKIRQALNIKGDERKKIDSVDMSKLVGQVIVEGDVLVKFSKCCIPALGDTITGFKMKDGKVSVHRGDCPNLTSMKAFQNVPVRWKNTSVVKEHRINITVTDRVGLAADILNVFSRRNLSLSSINTRPKKDKIVISIGVRVGDEAKLEQVLHAIRGIPSVVDLSVVR